MKKGLRQLARMLAVTMAVSMLPISASAASGTRFTDVSSDKWYAAPILWSVEEGVASGTTKTTFSPNQTCTKAQVLTFLWRACGSPEPKARNPYYDLQGSEYYYRAAVWAYENNITDRANYFMQNTPCDRSMAVKYMWKVAGSPQLTGTTAFTDVTLYDSYAQAVAWAVQTGITSGTTQTTFSPYDICTRAQVMAFLYRGKDIFANVENAENAGAVGQIDSTNVSGLDDNNNYSETTEPEEKTEYFENSGITEENGNVVNDTVVPKKEEPTNDVLGVGEAMQKESLATKSYLENASVTEDETDTEATEGMGFLAPVDTVDDTLETNIDGTTNFEII